MDFTDYGEVRWKARLFKSSPRPSSNFVENVITLRGKEYKPPWDR